MKYQLYKVGGCVRDKLLGVESKDIDYTVVLENPTVWDPTWVTRLFANELESQGFEVFLVYESSFIVRAKFPKGHKDEGLVADFVIARKEVGYIPGTRQPIVELGTLYDDLLRRDFTVNALAEDSDGKIIDYFGGLRDLHNEVLRTPVHPTITFNDDPLRILRAFRFACTKGFTMHVDIIQTIMNYRGDFSVVSTERVDQEINKMLKHDTYETLYLLNELKVLNIELYSQLFPEGWRLQMTNKK